MKRKRFLLLTGFFLVMITAGTCFAQSLGKQLHQAIFKNNISKVKQLLRKGPNLEPRCPPNYDCKPLVYAAALGRYEIVRVLIQSGADPNGRGAYQSVPLIQAFSAGTDYSKSGGPKGASKRTINDIQSYLLKHGADPNIPNAFGRSFFMGITAKCDIDLMKKSLRNGAKVNTVFENRTQTRTRKIQSDKNTALHLAVKSQCKEAIPLLLRHRADLQAKNADGLTPLELARKMKDESMVRLLSR